MDIDKCTVPSADVDWALVDVLVFNTPAIGIAQVYTVDVVVALTVAVATNVVSVPVILVTFLVEML